MDISHYNTLLRVYLDNGKDFLPDTILTELATNELIPNRVTYQHLITKFCLVSLIFIIKSANIYRKNEKELFLRFQEFLKVFYTVQVTLLMFGMENTLQIHEMIQCQIIHLNLPLTSVVVSLILD